MSMQDAVSDAIESGELELGTRKFKAVIPGPDGEPTELEVWEPTLEQIAWLSTIAGQSMGVQQMVSALGGMMEDLLEPEDYENIWKRLRNRRDPLTLDHVTEALAIALESVQDFPTQPSSASSPSSPTPRTGKRSTGRVRGPGSTSSS